MVLSEIFYEGQLYVKIQDLTQRPRIEMQGLGFKAFPGNLTPFSRENQEKKKKKKGHYYSRCLLHLHETYSHSIVLFHCSFQTFALPVSNHCWSSICSLQLSETLC